MRQFLTLTVIAALATGSALAATDEVTTRRTCINQWLSMSAGDKGSTERQTFVFKCMQASAAATSAGGSARCKGGATVTASTAGTPAKAGLNPDCRQ
jgi:hypothetical protein